MYITKLGGEVEIEKMGMLTSTHTLSHTHTEDILVNMSPLKV